MTNHLLEPLSIRPLLQGAIVANQWRQYRTNRWFLGEKHYYEFIGEDRSFCMKPSDVIKHISAGHINILKNGSEQLWN